MKRSNVDTFFTPSTRKTEKNQTKIGIGYVYIEESFDTSFNVGYGGGIQRPPWIMVRKNDHGRKA